MRDVAASLLAAPGGGGALMPRTSRRSWNLKVNLYERSLLTRLSEAKSSLILDSSSVLRPLWM